MYLYFVAEMDKGLNKCMISESKLVQYPFNPFKHIKYL